MHFDDAERARASAAHSRATALFSSITWHSQLDGRKETIGSVVAGFRTKNGVGAALSKGKMLERCGELLRQAGKTAADIFGDAGFGAATAQMTSLGVPHELHADADALRASTVQLAEVAHELATAELAGLRKEGKVTQRFRAPQTLAVLTAAAALLKDVDAWANPVAKVDAAHHAELQEGIEEVQAMGVGGAAADDDELDDEI